MDKKKPRSWGELSAGEKIWDAITGSAGEELDARKRADAAAEYKHAEAYPEVQQKRPVLKLKLDQVRKPDIGRDRVWNEHWEQADRAQRRDMLEEGRDAFVSRIEREKKEAAKQAASRRGKPLAPIAKPAKSIDYSGDQPVVTLPTIEVRPRRKGPGDGK